MRTVATCADLLLEGRYKEVKRILKYDQINVDDISTASCSEASCEESLEGSSTASYYYGSSGSEALYATSTGSKSDMEFLDRSSSERPASSNGTISSSIENVGSYSKDGASMRSSHDFTPQSPPSPQSPLAG